MVSLSLFIFRRDLRLTDNTALLHALQESHAVIPCFILDPRQINSSNSYRSINALHFMYESLEDLQEQVGTTNGILYILSGKAEEVIAQLLRQEKIEAVYCNKDYTPFSIARDKAIQEICSKSNVAFRSYDDVLLNPPESQLKKDGTAYAVFTAFYKNALRFSIANPHTIHQPAWGTFTHAKTSDLSILKKEISQACKMYPGGRSAGKKILKKLETYKNYEKERDYPALDATTHLSAHLKFGTLSVREVYHAFKKTLGPAHPLLRQLYWRDFFTSIAFYHPLVLGAEYNPKYRSLPWRHEKALFEQWCDGKTGFPIVDAGMRELRETGFMHNRVRMIVASFLTKDLRIDWRWGERYFAQHLVDYDPAVNNGNWQWCASTGCDAQPYFRIFNPWLQQKKFDPDGIYIKKWVPELKDVSAKTIHTLFKSDSHSLKNYPSPMVDHLRESKITIAWFKKYVN